MHVLAVIDVQKDFVDGALGSKDAQAIIPNIVNKIKYFDGDEIDITHDTHDINYLNTQEGKHLPIIHTVKGTDGWELAKPVFDAIDQREDLPRIVFDKITFGSVDLALHLRSIGATKVTIIGLDTCYCVISNMMVIKAFCPEIEIVIDAACCACATPETHELALKVMQTCHATIENWEG